jgi:hypothetical protein
VVAFQGVLDDLDPQTAGEAGSFRR